ncbi:TPA: hypothetical protein ACG4LE_003875, partial [Stenotrophomonas maltophilia]
MAWIYRVDQGRHLPEQSTKVDTDQNNMPFRQIAESVERASKDGFTASPAIGPTPPSPSKPASAVASAVASEV